MKTTKEKCKLGIDECGALNLKLGFRRLMKTTRRFWERTKNQFGKNPKYAQFKRPSQEYSTPQTGSFKIRKPRQLTTPRFPAPTDTIRDMQRIRRACAGPRISIGTLHGAESLRL